jgi:hypothetical protein
MKQPTDMLAAYLEGEVTPSEKASVDAELADSATARRHLAQLEVVRDALAAPIAELETSDLAPQVMQAIEAERALERAGHRRRVNLRAVLLTLGAAACAAAGLVILARPGPDEFRSKAAAPAGALDAQRWAGVHAYHVSGSDAPARLGAHLPAGDGLLFGYTNLGPRPFGYLMIFAVDARGAVRWCYPAYERAGDNPTSIPIHTGEAAVPLAEVIHHDLAAGPLEIRALFTMRPLDVAAVEAWLGRHPAPGAPLPWPDALLQVIDTTVDQGGAP